MTGTSSASFSISPSLVAQRFDGIEPRSAPRRIKRGEEGQRQRHDHDGGRLAGIDLGRQLREKVELRRKQLGVGEPGQEFADRFDVQGYDQADEETHYGAD